MPRCEDCSHSKNRLEMIEHSVSATVTRCNVMEMDVAVPCTWYERKWWKVWQPREKVVYQNRSVRK